MEKDNSGRNVSVIKDADGNSIDVMLRMNGTGMIHVLDCQFMVKTIK